VSFNALENLEKPVKTVLYRKRAKYHCKKFGKAITATAAVVHARRPNFHPIFDQQMLGVKSGCIIYLGQDPDPDVFKPGIRTKLPGSEKQPLCQMLLITRSPDHVQGLFEYLDSTRDQRRNYAIPGPDSGYVLM
jgi:hypothetical protein